MFVNQGNGRVQDPCGLCIRKLLGLRNAQHIEAPHAVENRKALEKGRRALNLPRSDSYHPQGLPFIVKELFDAMGGQAAC